jgi:hypothetical protein
LGRERNRDDETRLEVKRVLRDAFPDRSEFFTLRVEAATREIGVRIIWPAERQPTAVSVAEPDRATHDVMAELRDEGGHRAYEQVCFNPRAGSEITVTWQW